MRRSFLSVLVLALASFCFSGCHKNKESDTTVNPVTPRTSMPVELVGKWQVGTFSMTTFWNYDGSLQGNAGEYSLSYNITKDGNAEEYFYAVTNSYGTRLQVLSYRKGTMTWDEASGTVTFYASSGNYRKYMNGTKEQKNYTAADLYPQYKAGYTNCQVEFKDGAIIKLHCKNANSGNEMTFDKAHW